MNLVYTMRCIDERLARVGTESRAADGRRRGAGFIEGSEGEAGGENERADVSEVIEATGHPGRKSHESRASGREQCRAALLVRLLLLLLPSLSRHFPAVPPSFSFSSSSSSSLGGPLVSSAVLQRSPLRSVRAGDSAEPIAIGIAPRRLCTY